MKKNLLITVFSGLVMLAGCSSTPEFNGMKPEKLEACPNTPNCVNSQETGFHSVEPFIISNTGKSNWNDIVAVVIAMPRTTVVENTDGYLHVEVSTAVFHFTDDLELLLNSNGKTIDIRSASRLGLSDLGANSRRVESLRKVLKNQKLIE